MYNKPAATPGPYLGGGQATMLNPNEQQYLLQAQSLPAGGSVAANGGNPSASIAVQLYRIKGQYYPFGMSLQVWFQNAAGVFVTPGNFEIDLQTADIDADQYYVTTSSLVNAASLNSSFSGRIELPTFWALFTRVYIKTLTNPVFVSALVTR